MINTDLHTNHLIVIIFIYLHNIRKHWKNIETIGKLAKKYLANFYIYINFMSLQTTNLPELFISMSLEDFYIHLQKFKLGT